MPSGSGPASTSRARSRSAGQRGPKSGLQQEPPLTSTTLNAQTWLKAAALPCFSLTHMRPFRCALSLATFGHSLISNEAGFTGIAWQPEANLGSRTLPPAY